VPLAAFNRYSYSKVARLMQKLDALGALDNTLIYASSDMGNPALHSTQNTPTVLAGGAGGKFRMGRRLKMPLDCPATNLWCSSTDSTFQGLTNNHLLVSIAQAFGVDINTFGTQTDPKHTTGPLPNLT
jgi:arylsulfatase A-like enzyme